MKKLALLLSCTLIGLSAHAGNQKELPRIGYPYKSFSDYFRMAGAVVPGNQIEWKFKKQVLDCRFDNGVCQWAYFAATVPYSMQEVVNTLVNMTGEPLDNWQYKVIENGSTNFATKDGVFAANAGRDLKSLMVGYWAYIQNTNIDGSTRSTSDGE